MAKKVLIAEDDAPLRNVLEKRVGSVGYEVVTARTGTEAIEKITAQKPDLILLDIIMPEKSGFDVLEEIRLKQHINTPVIVLTNLEQAQDRETGQNLGVAEYLIKSNIHLRDLTHHISTLIGTP